MNTAELETAARRAAQAADVDVRLLRDHLDTARVAEIFSLVWGREATHVPSELGVAFIESGNYVAGAFSEDGMVGATVAFLGWHDGTLHLHSHITGVVAEARGRGVGFALKLHQGVWAQRRGIGHIIWSFDPLIRANADFNLNRLGATPISYRQNLYGPLEDQFSARTESDRLIVDWNPTSAAATAVRNGRHRPPTAQQLVAAGAIAAVRNENGPVADLRRANRLCVQIPPDIVTLRTAASAVAEEWSMAIRSTLSAAMDDGYVVTGFDPAGWYVLEATR